VKAASPRAIHLAMRILASYGNGLTTVRPVERVMRSRGRTAPSQVTALQALTDIRLALVTRLTLAFQRNTTATPLLQWRDAARQTPADRHAATGLPVRSTLVVDRLLARTERVEQQTVYERRTTVEREATMWPRVPPPPGRRPDLVVRRTVVMPADVIVAPPRDEPAARPAVAGRIERSLAPPAPTAAMTPIPLSPRELSRLTDQVVRAIDRRVLAYQERMGAV
jgi:hypothetical protein